MAFSERIRKYRQSGGAADLIRVEVLVPKSRRDDIVDLAAELRSLHRAGRDRLAEHMRLALERYGSRILDNIDLDKADDLAQRARLVAGALMERGDARAYAMGRKIMTDLEDMS